MGCASATPLFDGAVRVALEFVPQVPVGSLSERTIKLAVPESVIISVVYKMYTTIDWDDWDTQDESEYFEPYLKEVMIELGEIDPEEWE